jgi:hypothetical protein
LSEFGLDLIVLVADADGTIVHESTLDAILPQAFGPDHLPRG